MRLQQPSFTIYQPLPVGTSILEHNEDIFSLIWPTYRRQSVAMGGDFAASFQFSADDITLERWRDNYLGAHFVEYYGTQTAFMGILNTQRLTYNGQLQITTLDELYNNIAVRYQAGSSATPGLTAFASNSASIARYGTRTLIVPIDGYVNATRAAEYRDTLLNRLAYPRVYTQEVNWTGENRGILQVDVKGYVTTLDWQMYQSTAKVAANASTVVSNVLSGADFVTSGTITTNTSQEMPEADYVPKWEMIRRIAEHGDSSGDTWLAGCYQGRALDYWQPDLTTITYRYNAKAWRKELRRVIYDANNAEVPEAMVLPGRLIFAQDIMPGVPLASDPLDDPRVVFIGAVDFSREGLALRAQPRDRFLPPPPPDEAVKMSLMATLQKAKEKLDRPILVTSRTSPRVDTI